jgi:hypothetical protein
MLVARLPLAGLTVLALTAGARCQEAPVLVLTRERFDAMDRVLDGQRDLAHAKADAYAWGESYMLRGYLEMYLATGDADYLRRLVRVADQILATREARTAVWSVGDPYTVARLTLKDAEGRDALLLRSIRYAYNGQTVVEVQPGTAPGTFTLSTRNAFWQEHGPAAATFADLSLDPASPRYFEAVINDPRYVPEEGFERSPAATEGASFLLVARDLRRGAQRTVAPLPPTNLVADAIPYYGYIGPIYSGMTRFACLVRGRPELQREFGGAARRYVRAARESLDAWESCWRDGPADDEGYYLLQPKGAGMWCDGIAAPFNYLGSAGMVLLDVWECAGDERALDHATRIARLFRRACALTPQGGYSFCYWPPFAADGWAKSERLSVNTPEYGRSDAPDDLSHGAWEVEFAVACEERGIVFGRHDLRRFAKTFTRQLWTGDPQALASRVDGTGGLAQDSMGGGRWLDLCAVEPRIFELNRALWAANGWESGVYGQLAGCYARLFRWQEELGQRRPATD